MLRHLLNLCSHWSFKSIKDTHTEIDREREYYLLDPEQRLTVKHKANGEVFQSIKLSTTVSYGWVAFKAFIEICKCCEGV